MDLPESKIANQGLKIKDNRKAGKEDMALIGQPA